jgi:hypothetical protein
MARYEFEILLGISDVFDIEADSAEEARDEAHRRADAYLAVVPDGWSMPWDNIEITLTDSDAEDW